MRWAQWILDPIIRSLFDLTQFRPRKRLCLEASDRPSLWRPIKSGRKTDDGCPASRTRIRTVDALSCAGANYQLSVVNRLPIMWKPVNLPVYLSFFFPFSLYLSIARLRYTFPFLRIGTYNFLSILNYFFMIFFFFGFLHDSKQRLNYNFDEFRFRC